MKDSKPKKQRVDTLLVVQGLVESRTQAQTLIMAGKVFSGTQRIDKASQELAEDVLLRVAEPPRFVSRGGEKLLGFLKCYPIVIEGLIALDVGASTGGFTDCLLQHGAAQVTCVDVGRAQLHSKLLNDKRVTNLEKIHARELDVVKLPQQHYDIIVVDVSFISLTQILKPVWNRLKEGGQLIALVKPQFEATKAAVSKGKGIINNPFVHEAILEKIRNFVSTELSRAFIYGEAPSTIQGTDGNQEFLIGIRRK